MFYVTIEIAELKKQVDEKNSHTERLQQGTV
jgi:hypothetical protein